jgi:hypothetical protein
MSDLPPTTSPAELAKAIHVLAHENFVEYFHSLVWELVTQACDGDKAELQNRLYMVLNCLDGPSD